MSWKAFLFGDKWRLGNDKGQTVTDQEGKPIEFDHDPGPANPGPKEGSMKETDSKASVDPTPKPEASNPPTPTPSFRIEDDPKYKAMAAQIEQLSAANERSRKAAIKQNAEAFALKIQDRILPAAKAAFIGLHESAAEDDYARPVPEGQKTRVEQLESMVWALPKTDLGAKMGGRPLTAQDQIVPNSDNGEDETANASMSEDRRRQLLGHTAIGRQILENERANKRG